MFAHFLDNLAKQLRQHTSLRTISFDMRRLNAGNYRFPAVFIDVINTGMYGPNNNNVTVNLTVVTAPLGSASWQQATTQPQGPTPATAGTPGQGLAHMAVAGEIYQALGFFATAAWTVDGYAQWQSAVQADAKAGAQLGAFVQVPQYFTIMQPLPLHQRRKLGAWAFQTQLNGLFEVPTQATSYAALRDVAARPMAAGSLLTAQGSDMVLPTPTPASY